MRRSRWSWMSFIDSMRSPVSNELRVFTPRPDFRAASACERPRYFRSSRSFRTRSIGCASIQAVSCCGLVLGGGAEKLADGTGGERHVEIAFDRKATDAHGKQFREGRVAPLVAVRAE